MTQWYVPELGHAAFGNPTGEFAVSAIGSAAVSALLAEVSRVAWNREQGEIGFDNEGDAEAWNAYGTGVEWHAYWWGGEETLEAERPNLSFAGVGVRWYKHPGRGESVDREMSPDAWSEWLDAALEAVRSADVDYAGRISPNLTATP